MTAPLKDKALPISQILTPISEEEPSGKDLRYENTYDKIKEARKADDPNLPFEIWETKLKVADWAEVKTICIDALCKQTKDLQIGAWLLEAMARISGLSGVTEGLSIIMGLCETFWETVFPEIEDDDIEFRVSPIVWINETLSTQLQWLPVTETTADLPAYSLYDYRVIARPDKSSDIDEEEKKRKFNKKSYEASVNASSDEFYEKCLTDAEQSIQTAKDIESFLDTECGADAPTLIKYRKGLEEVMNHLRAIVDQKQQMIAVKPVSGSDASIPQTNNNSLDGVKADQLKSRDEAYQLLNDIADFLIEIEPHSPTPYLVKRAVTWGNMELSELLMELLKDGQNIQQVYSLLGIKQ